MKKYILTLCAALALTGAFTACTDTDNSPMTEQGEARKVSIRATIDGGIGSRVALEDDATNREVKVAWKEGDDFKITVDGTAYTFTYNTDSEEFECSDTNFPTTFASAGTVTATYPATTPTAYASQPGTLEGAAALLTMTATLEVTEGQSTEGLALVFQHKSAILKLTATCGNLANQPVNVIFRASGLGSITTASPVTVDASGSVPTVYFAVSPSTATLSDATLTLSTATVGYSASMSASKQLKAGKLYNINKTLTDKAFEVKTADGKTTYEVSNAPGLQAWADATKSSLTTNLTLTANITLDTTVKNNWTPIGTYDQNSDANAFKGTIDGGGKTITGLRLNASKAANSFVAMLGTGGVIKNLKFADADVTGQYTSGIVVGSMLNGTIENCEVDAQSSFSGRHLTGGIVGKGSGMITNCTNHATVQGTNRVGGIAGSFMGTISGCTNNGKVTCTDHTGMPSGGIVGFMSTNVANKILNCTNNGEVTGNNEYVGGIVGYMQPNVTAFSIIGCTNTGKVESTYKSGGHAGGIIGGLYQARSNGMIYGCINKGSIAASSHAGGILGYNYDAKDAYIVACGNLSASLSATYNGGIAGAVKENADYIIGSWSVKAEGEEDTPICGYNPSSTSPISSYIFADNTTAITAQTIAAMNDAITTNKSDCTYQWTWTSGNWPTLSSSTGD